MSERTAAEDGEATPDPTRSELRLRRPSEIPAERVSRSSVRPSAFGPPRPSAPPLLLGAGAPEAEQAPVQAIASSPAVDEPAPASDTLEADAEPRPAPEAPPLRLVPAFFAAALPTLRPSWREGALPGRALRPLISVALFCSMIGLSAFTLLRVVRPAEQEAAAPAARAVDEARRALQSAGALAPRTRAVVRPAPQPSAPTAEELASRILALRLQGERALMRRNTDEAEESYQQIFALEEGNARAAHGMARVRLAQGNLTGAEGWIQVAIRKRPRRAAYHALYAEILTQLGREQEALDERLRAAGGVQADDGADERPETGGAQQAAPEAPAPDSSEAQASQLLPAADEPTHEPDAQRGAAQVPADDVRASEAPAESARGASEAPLEDAPASHTERASDVQAPAPPSEQPQTPSDTQTE